MEFSSYKLSIIMRNLTFYLCILTFFLSSFNSHSREINNPNPPFHTISSDTYNLHALMKYVSLRPDYDLTKSYSAFLRTITFCPSDFSVNVDSGTCGAVVTYTSPTTDIAGGHMELTSAYGQGDTFPLGATTVIYEERDSANNPTGLICSFVVTVVDNEAATITLNGANPQIIEACGTYNELGATANDICFGDISGSIIIDASAVNTAVVGTYTVTYDVTDAAGNVATQVTRTVNVVDTTAPTITLVGANPQTIEACGTYNELGATAHDICFGDISGSIIIDASAVNTAVVGTYTVTYDVTDAAGNVATQVTRTVNVVDTTAPTITLNGANPQTIEACGTYNELGATGFNDLRISTIKCNGWSCSVHDIHSSGHLSSHISSSIRDVIGYRISAYHRRIHSRCVYDYTTTDISKTDIMSCSTKFIISPTSLNGLRISANKCNGWSCSVHDIHSSGHLSSHISSSIRDVISYRIGANHRRIHSRGVYDYTTADISKTDIIRCSTKFIISPTSLNDLRISTIKCNGCYLIVNNSNHKTTNETRRVISGITLFINNCSGSKGKGVTLSVGGG